MKIEQIIINQETGASLTRYALDHDGEMQNVSIRPAVLVIPGGGYAYCSSREAEPVALAFVNMGFHAFVLKYSVGMHGLWPTPLREAEYAMKMIRDHADEWAIASNKIAVIGFSAGGHLTAALGTIAKERPNAIILGYPGINPHVLSDGFAQKTYELHEKTIEPIPVIADYVDDQTPPAFLFAAGEDNFMQYQDYAPFLSELQKRKIPLEIHYFAYGGHGFSLATSHTSSGLHSMYDPYDRGLWTHLCGEWLKKTWGDFSHNGTILDANIQVVSQYQGTHYSLDDRLDTLFAEKACAAILHNFLPSLETVPETKRSVSAVYALRLMGVGKGVHFDSMVNAEKELNRIMKNR